MLLHIVTVDSDFMYLFDMKRFMCDKICNVVYNKICHMKMISDS